MQAFTNLVVCDGVPLKPNQARVIQLLKDGLHAEDTSYMLCDDPSRLPYRARRAAMLAMQDGADWEPHYIKVDDTLRVTVICGFGRDCEDGWGVGQALQPS